jgi:hypothetical protein
MNKQYEYGMHVAFWDWICLNPALTKYMFAIEHGERRDKRTGAKLKRKGVKAGMLDYFFMWPNSKFTMLWIEFKYGRNKPTAPQLEFASLVESAGGKVLWCYSVEAAIEGMLEYIELDFK